MVPFSGTWNAVGIANTTSGFPMFQPSTKLIGLGASLGFPAVAPVSTHEIRVFISAADSVRSFSKWPYLGSANHGGIFLLATAVLIAFAHGRVPSYVRNDIGPASPGRWQFWQFF